MKIEELCNEFYSFLSKIKLEIEKQQLYDIEYDFLMRIMAWLLTLKKAHSPSDIQAISCFVRTLLEINCDLVLLQNSNETIKFENFNESAKYYAAAAFNPKTRRVLPDQVVNFRKSHRNKQRWTGKNFLDDCKNADKIDGTYEFEKSYDKVFRISSNMIHGSNNLHKNINMLNMLKYQILHLITQLKNFITILSARLNCLQKFSNEKEEFDKFLYIFACTLFHETISFIEYNVYEGIDLQKKTYYYAKLRQEEVEISKQLFNFFLKKID